MSEPLVVPGLDQEDIGTLLNVRTYEYYVDMVKKIQNGVCPFCELDTEKNHPVYVNESWLLWKNPYPNENTALHLVLAHIRPDNHPHLTHVGQMRWRDWEMYGDAVNFALRHYDIPGGALVMRFGDPALNAGSIRHLHSNLMVPDRKGELRIPLAKDPKDIAEKHRVLLVFEKMRQGAALWELSREERVLVEGRLK